ncbi:Ribosomal RNA large subunit methyltransferase H [Bacteroidales bacterium Barb4]|nr:Ribosomal RNA large subunit methyltransferase H [Bacteroidales bacterium Barb4]
MRREGRGRGYDKVKIALIVTGKTDAAYFTAGIEEYKNRLVHYIPFEMICVPDIKNTKSLSESQQKEKEGELILKALCPGDYLVLLDECGKEYTSVQFASLIEKKMQTVSKRLVFVVGGAYGFSKAVYQAAAEQLSLSKMTFSHQMIRLLFLEQLYRAMTILHNEPYHHG